MYRDAKIRAKKKRGEFMPPIAAVERERETYCEEMEAYIVKLKALPPKKAKANAKKSLMQAGIIDENGELTDRYSNSRQK